MIAAETQSPSADLQQPRFDGLSAKKCRSDRRRYKKEP